MVADGDAGEPPHAAMATQSERINSRERIMVRVVSKGTAGEATLAAHGKRCKKRDVGGRHEAPDWQFRDPNFKTGGRQRRRHRRTMTGGSTRNASQWI